MKLMRKALNYIWVMGAYQMDSYWQGMGFA